jgi:predicted NBD/HSP70 family sugar kinase
LEALPADDDSSLAMGRHLDGCRIGFDLGGSDRKAAALIDGKVVYSEEIRWDPYFQADPAYHIEGVHDTLARAAAHLPRVDAIGGSAAGVYVNNEVRVASLFRGVPADQFEKHIRRMFFTLQARWGGVPFEVANDGEVTALAGAMSMNDERRARHLARHEPGRRLRHAGGQHHAVAQRARVRPGGLPRRCAARRVVRRRRLRRAVFLAAGVGRLAAVGRLRLPRRPAAARATARGAGGDEAGRPRARAIYETIGVCFGYAIAHYADFYDVRNLLILGRVTSGEGGEIILAQAAAVLRAEFPALAEKIRLRTPDEQDKRHGQAVAAASLPRIPATRRSPPTSRRFSPPPGPKPSICTSRPTSTTPTSPCSPIRSPRCARCPKLTGRSVC